MSKKLLYILKLAAITIVINLWFIVPFIYYYIFGDLYTTALDWSKFYEYSIYLSGILSTSNLVHCRALSLGIPVAAFLIFAFIYLAEVISVILQVGFFKLTGGKRIFKMAPIHHHFELCGWEETRVVAVFSAVTAILCIVALMAM